MFAHALVCLLISGNFLLFSIMSLFFLLLIVFFEFPFIFLLPLGFFFHFLFSFGGILLCTRVLPIISTHFGRVARFTWTQAHFMYAPVGGCAIYFALGYVRLGSCMSTNFRSMSLYFQQLSLFSFCLWFFWISLDFSSSSCIVHPFPFSRWHSPLSPCMANSFDKILGDVARFTWTQAHFMYAPVRGCAIYFALAYVRTCSCTSTLNFSRVPFASFSSSFSIFQLFAFFWWHSPCISTLYACAMYIRNILQKFRSREGEPDDRVTKKNRYLVKRASNTNE